MAFLGPLLGVGASALGAGLQYGAQQDANNINWANLFETKRANREAEELQRASREDALGNLIHYTPGVGWEIDVTPLTKSILGAQQKEQLASLTQDAPRNRAAAERMDARSRAADDAYKGKFTDFLYRPRTTEDEDIHDATTELLNARRKGLDESSAMLARQLIRTGGSSELANVYKQANDQYASSLEDAILRGKQIGRQRHAQSVQDDFNDQGKELEMLRNIANGTTTSNIQDPHYNEQLTGRADNALQQLYGAMRASQGATDSAYGRLASSVGQSPNLSGLAAALARLDFGQSEQEDPAQPLTWAQVNAGW